jgi:signal transduction histidine kinase
MAIPSGRERPCVVHRTSRFARASRRARRDGTDTEESVGTIPEMDARRANGRYGSRTTMEPHVAQSAAVPPAGPSTLQRVREALSARPLVVDTAIALFLAALSLLANFGGPAAGQPTAVGLALLLLESLPLIVRRRFPLAVLAVIVGATVVQIALLPAGQALQAGLGILVAVYTVGERVERRRSVVATALAGAVLAIGFVAQAGIAAVLLSLVQTELIFVVAWLLGDAARIRRLYAGALEERAQRLERERDERAQRAVRGERERIARELHDVVTHHVTVMVIQAGGASRVIELRPDEARMALEAIGATGRLALTDMRRMIGILGEPDASEPTPGLDRLDELLEQLRSAGLAVELVIEGEPRPLDPGLEVSAYRIVQEALTNSLKHARGGRARVVVRYLLDALEIEVEDKRGPGPSTAVEPPHQGQGLIGMRERAAMLRGTFVAHSTPTGFLVTARLPIDGAASAA